MPIGVHREYDIAGKVIASKIYNDLGEVVSEGIIDEDFNWTYGDGHLIISGDLFDRGYHITECMWLLYKLESEAEAQGGKLHLIIGNHEMFNMTDDWRYVEVKYFNDAHLMGKRMSELYDSDTELGRWLRTKSSIGSRV